MVLVLFIIGVRLELVWEHHHCQDIIQHQHN